MYNRVKSCQEVIVVELFECFIQQLPAMRKRAAYLFQKAKPEDKLKRDWKFDVAAAMIEWIWDELLDEHTILYQTFLRAGYTNKIDMRYYMFKWYLFDNRLRQRKK